jgi:hypothetical protein
MLSKAVFKKMRKNSTAISEAQTKYIQALKEVDKINIKPLSDFATS